MKLVANISMLFGELPLAERFAAARDAGFDGVELLFPYDHEPRALRDLADAAGMPVLQINTPRGNEAAGEVGLAALAGEESRFRESFERALHFAEGLGCPQLHILSGRVAATNPGFHKAHATLRQNLGWAAEQAAARKLVLLIEALNSTDFPDYVVPTPAVALELIRDLARPNVKLQFDLYHCQRMAVHLTRALESAATVLGHVQIAGAPERHEPDTGAIDYLDLLRVLKRIGYRGAVSAEYRPAAGTLAGLGWMAQARSALSLQCNDHV